MLVIFIIIGGIKMNIKIEKQTVDKIVEELSKVPAALKTSLDTIEVPGQNANISIGYMTGTVKKDNVVIDGVYVPKQSVGKAWVAVEAEDQVKSFKAIKKSGKDVIGIVQYNGDFAVFESAILRKAREALTIMGVPDLSLVVNKKGEYRLFP